jgi:hypothetical protein
MTKGVLWELKCTSEITAENMIQTVVYAWIVRTLDPGFSKKVKIFNIKTGQVLRLDASLDELTMIVVAILKGKYERQPPSTEADFLSECRVGGTVGSPDSGLPEGMSAAVPPTGDLDPLPSIRGFDILS